MQFKSLKSNKTEQFSSNDIENISWVKRSKGFGLKFELKTGVNQRFDGFQEPVYKKKKKKT